MRTTRRGRAAIAGCAALLVLGVLSGTPSVIVGGAVLVGWLVTHYATFGRRVDRAIETTTVDWTVTPETVYEGQSTRIQGVLTRAPTVAGDTVLAVEPDLPLAFEQVDGETRVTVDDDGAVIQIAGRFDVAGAYAIGPAILEFGDRFGLVTDTRSLSTTAEATVEPSEPTDVSVGTGGERFSVGVGEHDIEHGRGDVEPGELRTYQPGDPYARIDWKATARQNEPYVRDSEAVSDLETLLIVDHRATTGAGPGGRTHLAYLREVAVWLTTRGRDLGDPIGLVTFGDGGITTDIPVTGGGEQYRRIRRRLFDLTPTTGQSIPDSQNAERGPRSAESTEASHRTLFQGAEARQAAGLLADDTTPFERTLRPYYSEAETYVQRVADRPLFETVRSTLERFGGTPWVVILTTDSDRPQLYETVKLAARSAPRVAVFVSPDVLVQGPDAGAPAHDAYVEFEEFRRRLSGVTGVTAYDVGERHRIESIVERPRGRAER